MKRLLMYLAFTLILAMLVSILITESERIQLREDLGQATIEIKELQRNMLEVRTDFVNHKNQIHYGRSWE